MDAQPYFYLFTFLPFYFFTFLLFLNLKVETRALYGIGANLSVGHSYMGRVLGIAFKGFFTLQRTVEHDISIRRSQPALDMHFHVQQTRNLAYQSFQTSFNTCLNGLLLFFR